ncbi:unnamed protein product [Rotaria magnacalcarata]|uniref:Uncharacterized protein n=1 Tax=Rotaria magnacalcarata TaxID=392030 RepID=A0A816R4E9_9BILA|nr:unnamed protein product [Rotaria magnacalcarata]
MTISHLFLANKRQLIMMHFNCSTSDSSNRKVELKSSVYLIKNVLFVELLRSIENFFLIKKTAVNPGYTVNAAVSRNLVHRVKENRDVLSNNRGIKYSEGTK